MQVNEYLLEMFIRELKLQCIFARGAFNGLITELQQQNARMQELDIQAQRLMEEHRNEVDALRDSAGVRGPADQSATYEMHDRHSQELIDLYEFGTTWTVFFFAYSFLVHAAIISKILWSGTKVHGKEKRAVGPEKVTELEQIRASRSETLRLELNIEGTWSIHSTDLRDDLEHYDERIEAWFVRSPRRNVVDLGVMSRSSIAGLDSQDFRRNLDPTTLSFFIEDTDYDLPTMMSEVNKIYETASTWLKQNSVFARIGRRDSQTDPTPE